MAQNVAAIAEGRPDDPALIDERGTTSWCELDGRVNRLIHALREAGLGKGSTVAVLMGNRREYFEILSACSHAAMLTVPINWHFSAEEVTYVLENSDAQALITDERFSELALGASRGNDRLAARALTGVDDLDGLISYETLLAGASAEEPEEQGEGGVMFYTSGTTGRPKGVRRLGDLGGPLTRGQVTAQGMSMTLGIPAGGTTLLCGPLYHSAQWAFSYLPLGAGNAVVMTDRFDAQDVLELIDQHRVTNIHLVPTQFIRLLRVDADQRRAFSGDSLVTVLHGAAPCPRATKQQMIDWWGPVISEYYGGTEGAVVSIIGSQDWQEKPGSVGKPLPIVEVRILDSDGQDCAAGESGQIYIRSMMAPDFEYHGEPEKTSEAHLEPGVFTMGDIGYLDEHGFLYLTDRKIDMIISGGVNIYPAEIEQVLGDHEAVGDVAVIGIPDEEFGEQVKAIIEVLDGFQASEELTAELIAYCRERLAGYKAPKTIDYTDSLPRHPTGKLYKRLLRDPYWEGHERRI